MDMGNVSLATFSIVTHTIPFSYQYRWEIIPSLELALIKLVTRGGTSVGQYYNSRR